MSRSSPETGLSNPLRDALMRGFLSTSTSGSEHYIKISFKTLELMQEARKELYHAIRNRVGVAQTPAALAALEPFARAADGAATVRHPDDFLIWQEVTVGDLRRAKAALSDTSTDREDGK